MTEELKEQDIRLNKLCFDYQEKEKRIAELEKENTELKERVSTFEQIKKEHTAYTIKVEEERTSVKEQFIKAKEIIKNLIDDLEVIDGEQIRELEDFKEAEQLLKDSEVKK